MWPSYCSPVKYGQDSLNLPPLFPLFPPLLMFPWLCSRIWSSALRTLPRRTSALLPAVLKRGCCHWFCQQLDFHFFLPGHAWVSWWSLVLAQNSDILHPWFVFQLKYYLSLAICGDSPVDLTAGREKQSMKRWGWNLSKPDFFFLILDNRLNQEWNCSPWFYCNQHWTTISRVWPRYFTLVLFKHSTILEREFRKQFKIYVFHNNGYCWLKIVPKI